MRASLTKGAFVRARHALGVALKQLLAPRVIDVLRDLLLSADFGDRPIGMPARHHDFELLRDRPRALLLLVGQVILLRLSGHPGRRPGHDRVRQPISQRTVNARPELPGPTQVTVPPGTARPSTMSGVSADASETRRDVFIQELEVLAWIGPADSAMIAAQHGIRSEEDTIRRLELARAQSLTRVQTDGRYALTDDGYSVLRDAVDGES